MHTTDSDNLINLSTEDDALLPPSLNGEFIGFRLSVSEKKRSCAARLLPAAAGHGYEPDRKSLSWHNEFLTNDGILDAEELMMFNRGLRKKDLLKKRETQTTTVSRSHTMARVPAKRIAAAVESSIGSKKQRSSLLTSVRSGIVPTSSSSFSGGSSLKNMLKASVSFLKRRVGTKNKDSFSSCPSSSDKFPLENSSKKSKANSVRPAHPGRRSMPKMPLTSKTGVSVLSPSTPPDNKSMGFYEEGLRLSLKTMSYSATKETLFRTPVSKPSGLRLPSARFGFFDFEKKSSSSKCEETFHTAPTTTSSANKSAKKLKSSTLSPVPYLPSLQSEASDKENKFSNEARVDDLSKNLVSIDLNTDLVIDLQCKRVGGGGGLQLQQPCNPTDHSATTPPLKQAVPAQRTPLAAHNRSLYSSASSRY